MSAPSATGPSGPPIRYTPALAEQICERLAVHGESLTSICKSQGMPSYRAVMGWLDRYPKFAQIYARARDIQTDLIAEEILDISDDSLLDWVTDQDGNRVVDHDHISRSRLRVDSRKWMASKLKPKKYGEKVLHTGADGEGPIAVKVKHDYSLLTGPEMAQLLALLEKMLERQREGIAKAASEGKYKGRAPTAKRQSSEVIRLAKDGVTRQAIADQLGVGIASVYRILAEARSATYSG